VQEIMPDFVDPATNKPLPGREGEWNSVTEYRVDLAREERAWRKAEHLQHLHVNWNRQRAAAALAVPPEALDITQRNAIRWLAVSLAQLGSIQYEQGKPECIEASQEAITLYQRIGDSAAEATRTFNLGHAYQDLPALRDLEQAERWYRRSLELREERDRLGRARCLGELGGVTYERFREARDAQEPESEQLRHLNDAAQFYHQALDLLPANAVNDLAVTHNQLGIIYGEAGDFDRALTHFREAIRYDEMQGNLYGAGRTRRNVASHLALAGRFADAREYALAALRNYRTYGDRAAADIERTEGLIAQIEQDMRGT